MSVAPGGGVDWGLVRGRVDVLAEALCDPARSPEETARVLEERARALAVPRSEAEPEELLEVIELEIAGESYALETRFLMEVTGAAETALFPGAQPPIVGIVAWRGDVLPLLDIRWTLGHPAAEPDRPLRVIVLGEARPAFAIQVDAVLDLRHLPASSLLPLPDGGRGGGRYLRGTTNDAFLVLDAAELIGTHG